MNRIARIAIGLMALALASASALAQETGWPRTLALDEGMVTIYAPQVEAMDEGVLYYRAALAYRPDADAEPIFGAGWLRAPVDVDESKGIVHPTRLELTQTRFPDGTTDVQAELATALSRQSSDWNLDFSVDELEAALDAAEAESLAAQQLKTAPPKIIYRDRPALLVTIDGDPVLREIENSSYEAVINTPFPLISDGDNYYLNAAKGVWYRADAATGPYRFDSRPPQDIVKMVEESEAKAAVETRPEDVAEREPVTADTAPEIVVSTVPAELVVTEGPADFVPLVDDLLVLQNSDDDVFMHVGEQKYYIVLAGRWYRANSLEGPWEFHASDDLPAAFAKIPDDSAQADSRVYVAGTEEAGEAVLDAQVPQTAAVKRGEVDIDVEYDGDPDFDRVDGTEDLSYAKNTGATVLESDRTYYLLEDGVWYVSSSPHGPWVVSDHRPGELDSIEPSSPVYNTKYVYVYDSTPEVVYVGYTPGYLGSYVYYDTIVYGTGWYYRPWVSPYYYYPRYSTWGFHVGYSDWGGWSFGLGWYWPYYSLNYYYGGYWHYGRPWYSRYWGFWGPRGYAYRPYYWGYPRYRHHSHNHYDKRHGKGHWYDGRRDKYAYNDYSRWDRNHDRYDRERNRNLYRDDRQRARVNQTRDRWRDDRGPVRNEQRFVDNRKVRQSSTGPVRPSELRRKADVRDINRAASRDPLVANNRGEVYRASFNPERRNVVRNDNAERRTSQNKIRENRTTPITRDGIRARAPNHDNQRDKPRENRTTPISREDLRRRGDFVARKPDRPDNDKSPVNRPQPGPSRSVDRSNRQVNSQPREVASRAPDNRPTRPSQRVGAPPGPVDQREPRTRPDDRSSRRIAAPPRQVEQREPRTRPDDRSNRRIAAPPRQVEQREPRTRPDDRSSREISAPSRREPAPMRQQRRAPERQMSREPSRPQRAAAPSPRREAAPSRSRSEAAPSRSRSEASPSSGRSERSAPQPRAERSSQRRPNEKSRGKPRDRNSRD